MRRSFSGLSKLLFRWEYSQRINNKHGSVLRHALFARRLRCEPLEYQQMLDAQGFDFPGSSCAMGDGHWSVTAADVNGDKLLYIARSVAANFLGHAGIWIISDGPTGLQWGDRHIAFTQKSKKVHAPNRTSDVMTGLGVNRYAMVINDNGDVVGYLFVNTLTSNRGVI